MIRYKEKESIYIRIYELAEKLGIEKWKMYDIVDELDKNGVDDFDKTPLGSNRVRKDQIPLIEEYAMTREVFGTPQEASFVMKQTSSHQRVKKDDDWARGLTNVVWRQH